MKFLALILIISALSFSYLYQEGDITPFEQLGVHGQYTYDMAQGLMRTANLTETQMEKIFPYAAPSYVGFSQIPLQSDYAAYITVNSVASNLNYILGGKQYVQYQKIYNKYIIFPNPKIQNGNILMEEIRNNLRLSNANFKEQNNLFVVR